MTTTDKIYPDKSELEINPETGYPNPPEGIKVDLKSGQGRDKKGIIRYGAGTFGRNNNTDIGFDTEKSLKALDTKRELQQSRLRQEIENKTGKPFPKSYAETGADIFVEVAKNPKERGGVRAKVYREIGELTGEIPSKHELQSSPVETTPFDNISPQLAGQLRELVLLISSGAKLELPEQEIIDITPEEINDGAE